MSKYYEEFFQDQPPLVDNLHSVSPKPIRSPDKPEQPDDREQHTNTPAPQPPPEPEPTLSRTARRQLVLAYFAFVRVFFRYGFEAVELQSAITAMTLGIWLLLPKPPAEGTGAFYDALNRLAPSLLYGSLVMLLGVTQFVALVMRHWQLRRATALISGILWSFFAVLFAMAGLGPLAPVYAVLTTFSAWSYFRLGRLRI